MLPRAVLRVSPLRPTIITPLNGRAAILPTASSALWTRQYAQFGGSGGGSKKPPTYQPSNRAGKRPTEFTQQNPKQTEKPRDKGRDRDFWDQAKETPELNTNATASSNTAPQSQPGPDLRNTLKSGAQRPSNADSPASGRQDHWQSAKETPEFNEEASPSGNTAPDAQPAPQSSSSTQTQSELPRQPLPDLRQGIPSTFADEFLKQADKAQAGGEQAVRDENAKSETQKLDEEIEGLKQQEAESRTSQTTGGRGGGGELPRSAYETSSEKKRNKLLNRTYIFMLVFGTVSLVYAGRNWDTDEEEKAHRDAPSGWDLNNFWGRIKARYNEYSGYYTEPTFPKLLPTMDPAPPYTLVLSLEDLLIHSEWTRQYGYRTAKRPGLDYFIRYLSQYYEIVLFTSLPMTQAEPVYRKLDPYHIIMWPLFREATRYHNGNYIKDLSYLNRDLSKTILLDTKASHASANPENAIIIAPWKGDPKDRDLVSYIPFLENIAAMGYPDVRKAIKSFDGKHIPAEFARREAELRQQFKQQMEEGRSQRPKFSLGGVLNKSLGMKAQPAPGSMILGEDGSTASEGFERGLMLSDQIRERGRRQYEQLEKEIRDNGEKWLKEMEEEERKAQEEAMKGMKNNVGGVMGWFSGGKTAEPPTDASAQSNSVEGQR